MKKLERCRCEYESWGYMRLDEDGNYVEYEDCKDAVKEAYKAGFIAACKWPEPVTQDVDSSSFHVELEKYLIEEETI